MDSKDIETDLQLRIDQSRLWVTTAPNPLRLEFRNRDWVLHPLGFLDEPGRKERYGVGFSLQPADNSRNWKVQLNLRIQPSFNPEFEVHKYPYIVTYVVDQLVNAAVEISHIDIVTAQQYARLPALPIDEWYLYWVTRVLRDKPIGKMFEDRMQLGE